jgi:hypothetical protein
MRSVRFVSTFKKNLLLKIPAEFAGKSLSIRIYWGYLLISEFGKAFSQIGNMRGRVVFVQSLEFIQPQRMGLRRANIGERPTASLR